MNKPVKKSRKGGPKEVAEPKATEPKVAAAKVKEPAKYASGKANRYFILFFFIWAAILYGNTILNKYSVDDEFVTNNPMVAKGLKALPEIFSTFYVNQQGNIGSNISDYRPIVKATYALEYQLWGQKPGVSHGINMLIYWLLSVFLFFLLKRLLKDYNIIFPFLFTLIFMAHPVHTEVVASLKNRDEMFAFICGIGAMWFILDYADTRKPRYLAYAFIVFITGFLSKTSILPFLALYPLVLWFFTDFPPKKFIPVVLILLAAALVAMYVPRFFLPHVDRVNYYIENPLYFEKGLWIRLGTGFATLLFYLKLLVYPYPMVYYYGYDMIPVVSMGNIFALLSFVIHAGLFVYAVMKIREKDILSFAILWYLISISMYSNIAAIAVGIVAVRFVFLASVGFCLALVILIFRVFRTNPRSLTIEIDARLKILAVVILLLIPSTVLTVTRNRQWRNLWDLYNADIKHQERSANANLQYGGYLMRTVYTDPNFLKYGTVNQFKQQTIITHFRQSLRIYPKNYQALNDLGTIYLFMTDKPDSAVWFLQKAIELEPTLQPSWVNLGMAYRKMGQFGKAKECYEHLLKVNPNNLKAIFALADVYNDEGDFDRAVKINEDVMKVNPDFEMPYINIGNYYMMKADTSMAVKYWEQAASRNPSAELCYQLAFMYKIHGDQEKMTFYNNLADELNRKARK
jgi:Tfp pilus assembly protein PilF